MDDIVLIDNWELMPCIAPSVNKRHRVAELLKGLFKKVRQNYDVRE